MNEIEIIGRAIGFDEVEKEIQVKAIRNFVYFTFSYDPEFVSLIWGKDTVDAQHLTEKLKEYHYDVCRFFVNLDADNQRKMLEWVLDNYEG